MTFSGVKKLQSRSYIGFLFPSRARNEVNARSVNMIDSVGSGANKLHIKFLARNIKVNTRVISIARLAIITMKKAVPTIADNLPNSATGKNNKVLACIFSLVLQPFLSIYAYQKSSGFDCFRLQYMNKCTVR